MSLEAIEPARSLRKQEAATRAARKMLPITSSYFVDDFDDAGGIDDALSSNYEVTGGSVRVAAGQTMATVITVPFATSAIISSVELVVACTPVGSPTFDVSVDDGASWQVGVALETPISIPAPERGKVLRIRANLARGDSIEYWSAHL